MRKDMLVEGYADLKKKANSGGVINVNKSEYQKALARRRNAMRLNVLETQVHDIGDKLDSILMTLASIK